MGTLFVPLRSPRHQEVLRASLRSTAHTLDIEYECRLVVDLPITERVLCWSTAWALGGACWSTLTHPNREEVAALKTSARGLLQLDPTDDVEIQRFRLRRTGYASTAAQAECHPAAPSREP
jgi:hypothetical protein